VLTHPHLDHVGGAPAILHAVRVDRILDPGQVQGSDGYLDALQAAQDERAPWTVTTRGARFDLDGMELDVLHPEGPPAAPDVDPNAASVVLWLRYGEFSALLDGDAPSPVEEEAAAATGPVTVLKVGHHGSATSSSAAFLARAHPALALISVGRGNTFGHPTPEALARLEAIGARVLRSDQSGAVRVRATPDGRWSVHEDRPH
jgi:competence protein ComEC